MDAEGHVHTETGIAYGGEHLFFFDIGRYAHPFMAVRPDDDPGGPLQRRRPARPRSSSRSTTSPCATSPATVPRSCSRTTGSSSGSTASSSSAATASTARPSRPSRLGATDVREGRTPSAGWGSCPRRRRSSTSCTATAAQLRARLAAQPDAQPLLRAMPARRHRRRLARRASGMSAATATPTRCRRRS